MSKYDNASLVQIPSGYKAGTLYSVLPANGDGDFDFTRASIATRVNAEGLIEEVASGVPRLDYPILNGVVQSCPALLLEPARTNLLTYSEEFDGGSWSKFESTISANSLVSPDGSLNADKLIASVTADVHQVSKIPTLADSTNYSFSCFAKSGGYDFLRLAPTTKAGTTSSTFFDLSNGLVTTVGSGHTATIENYGNGWYRCAVNYNSSTGASTTTVRIAVSQLDNQVSFAGDGTSGLYIWGAQIEAGSYATSYIPTSGTSVARAAEVCDGAGTSAEFNDSEGVLFAEISALADDSSTRVITISDGTANERIQLFYIGSNQIASNVTDGGVGQASMLSSVNILNNNKFAFKYKLNDLALWSNGFKVSVDTVATMPTGLNTLSYDNGIGASVFYGKTKQIIAFDAALTDEQLENLTSWDSFEELAASQFYTLY